MGFTQAGAPPAVKDTGRIEVTTAFQDVGSGSSAHIITAAQNPGGLYIWHIYLSSTAAGTAGGFNSQDTVTSSDGAITVGVEVALASSGGNLTSNMPFELEGAFVAPGATVDLNNGGAGGSGALRHCTATVVYTALVASE